MGHLLQVILDWAEVWAVGIALLVLLFRWRQPVALWPVMGYLWMALVINLVGDVIADYKKYLPLWLHSNTPLYNVHSILRFICFSSFFLLLPQPSFRTLKNLLPWISLAFIALNFTLRENFFNVTRLSGDLLSVEAYLLLVYCMLYYLSQLNSDVEKLTKPFDFWIVTGLSIYVVINFFVFLFYNPMLDQQNYSLAIQIWNVHNIAYIIFCLFIAKAFYVSSGY